MNTILYIKFNNLWDFECYESPEGRRIIISSNSGTINLEKTEYIASVEIIFRENFDKPQSEWLKDFASLNINPEHLLLFKSALQIFQRINLAKPSIQTILESTCSYLLLKLIKNGKMDLKKATEILNFNTVHDIIERSVDILELEMEPYLISENLSNVKIDRIRVNSDLKKVLDYVFTQLSSC